MNSKNRGTLCSHVAECSSFPASQAVMEGHMIDWTRVADLRGEIGAEDFEEVAELFLMEVEDTLSRLNGAATDAAQMQELMHFLKGSALNLGFSDLSAVCSSGEEDAAEGQITVDIAQLKDLYAQSRALFESEYTQRFAA
jgi:HPt (histidine-containing phosphotransfer) domain-containing protein